MDSKGYIVPITDQIKNWNLYFTLFTLPTPKKIETVPAYLSSQKSEPDIVTITWLLKRCNGYTILFANLKWKLLHCSRFWALEKVVVQ
jgi:hypothetical protein